MALITTQPINITGVTLSNPTGAIGNYTLSYIIASLKKGSWKYNGAVYSGSIFTVGSGCDYATLYAAYDAVEFNASITTALLLVDPTATAGMHDSNLDGYSEGYLGSSGIKKTLFVRGTGALPTDTIITYELYGFYYYYMDCDVYLENITFTQRDYRICVPFNPISNNINFFINKCNLFAYSGGYCYGAVAINYQDNINTHISYTSMDKGSDGHKHLCNCNVSQINCDKVLFDGIPTGYNCYGGTIAGNWAETPTEGYGSAYGSLLITDWACLDEKTLSWGGGELVEIPTDGSYILSDGTNTITAMVDYSALPATDQSDMITISYDRYIAITPKTKYMKPGMSEQFIVTAIRVNGTTKDITSQSTFASSNTGVAPISSAGLAKAVAVGMTQITATYEGMTDTALIVVQNVLPSSSGEIVAFAADSGAYRSMEYKSKRYKFKPTSLSCIKVIAEKYPVEIDVIFPSLKRAQSISVTSSKAQRIKSALVDCCEIVIRGNSQVSAVFLASSMDELPL